MSLISNFKGLPVVLQLKEPIVAVYSSGEVQLSGNQRCGIATMTMMQGQNGPQPVILQLLTGQIMLVDEESIVFEMLGGDGKTPVRVFIPDALVQSVSFALEHPETQEERPMVTLS